MGVFAATKDSWPVGKKAYAGSWYDKILFTES